MAYMNLPKEEKRYAVVYKSGDKLEQYDSLNNRERVFLRACLLNRSICELKALVGYNDDRDAAKSFISKLIVRVGFSMPAMMWEDFTQDLLKVQNTVNQLYELKKRSLFQRIFNR